MRNRSGELSGAAIDDIRADLLAFLDGPTPRAWVDHALTQLDVLLLDHRNCELKAASTALSLMVRYPRQELAQVLSKLAREELVHHEQVSRLLCQRGIALRHVPPGRYAAELRTGLRTHEPARLVDTLIVGAFIEARSCERFAALAPHMDDELARFYGGLLQSEARHYRQYIGLARQFGDPGDVARSVLRVRELEGRLIRRPDALFRFHSGCPA